jgi:hypothetical protein
MEKIVLSRGIGGTSERKEEVFRFWFGFCFFPELLSTLGKSRQMEAGSLFSGLEIGQVDGEFLWPSFH